MIFASFSKSSDFSFTGDWSWVTSFPLRLPTILEITYQMSSFFTFCLLPSYSIISLEIYIEVININIKFKVEDNEWYELIWCSKIISSFPSLFLLESLPQLQPSRHLRLLGQLPSALCCLLTYQFFQDISFWMLRLRSRCTL